MTILSARLEALTPEQLDAAVDDTIDVVFAVLKFMRPATDPNADPTLPLPRPDGWRETWEMARFSLAHNELPDPAVLRRVADWALFELDQRDQRSSRLTPEEERVRVAALRLRDAAERTVSELHHD